MHEHLKPYARFRRLFFSLLSILVSSCATSSNQIIEVAEGKYFPEDNSVARYAQNHSGILKVVTLNVAHGRKEAVNQMLLTRDQIQQNLNDIADVLTDQNADIVALQEADGPSGWSGKFDHVQAIARQSGYPWYYRADHAKSWLFSYGTAVMSRWPISETVEHTFKPSPPTLNKGFLLSKMTWKPNPNSANEIAIDIISVHLDFSRNSVRHSQVEEMADTLLKRTNPMIILGDFNSDWFADESVVKKLAERANLKAYKPYSNELLTYKQKRRLDWILISEELEFVHYHVLPDLISDHFCVVAEIRFN